MRFYNKKTPFVDRSSIMEVKKKKRLCLSSITAVGLGETLASRKVPRESERRKQVKTTIGYKYVMYNEESRDK